jgi:hypothetical protein
VGARPRSAAGVGQARDVEGIGDRVVVRVAADQQLQPEGAHAAAGSQLDEQPQAIVGDRRQVTQVDEQPRANAGGRRVDGVVQAHRGVGVDLTAGIELGDDPARAPVTLVRCRRWCRFHRGLPVENQFSWDRPAPACGT